MLGPEFLKVLRRTGHDDEIATVDGSYPADTDAKRLMRMDGNDAVEILDAILSVLPVDDCVSEAVFRPAAAGHPDRIEAVHQDFAKDLAGYETEQKIVPLGGQAFYSRVKEAYAIVASGERRLYGSITVKKGVLHPEA
jgi:L-fucose mutarotase